MFKLLPREFSQSFKGFFYKLISPQQPQTKLLNNHKHQKSEIPQANPLPHLLHPPNSYLKSLFEQNNYFIPVTQANDADTLGALAFTIFMKIMKHGHNTAPIIMVCPPKKDVIVAYTEILENLTSALNKAAIPNVKIIYASENKISSLADGALQVIFRGPVSIFSSTKKSLHISYFDFPAAKYSTSVDKLIERINVSVKTNFPSSIGTIHLSFVDHHGVPDSVIQERKSTIQPDHLINEDNPEQPSCIEVLIKMFGSDVIERNFFHTSLLKNSEEIKAQVLKIIRQGLLTDWKARLQAPEFLAKIEQNLIEYPVIASFLGPDFKNLHEKLIKTINEEIKNLIQQPRNYSKSSELKNIFEIDTKGQLNWKKNWFQESGLEQFLPLISASDYYKNIQEITINQIASRYNNIPSKNKNLIFSLIEAKLRILYNYIIQEASQIYKETDEASIPTFNLAGIFCTQEGKKYFGQLNKSFSKLNLAQVFHDPFQLEICAKDFSKLGIKIDQNLEDLSENKTKIFLDLISEIIIEAFDSKSLTNTDSDIPLIAFQKDGFTAQFSKVANILGVTNLELKRLVGDTLRKHCGFNPFFVILPVKRGEFIIGANFPASGLTSEQSNKIEITPDLVLNKLQKINQLPESRCYFDAGSAGSRISGQLTSDLAYEQIVQTIKTVLE